MGRCRRPGRRGESRAFRWTAAPALIFALGAVTAGSSSVAAGPPPAGEPVPEPVRMGRATWDTGWFQAEVYRQLIEALGYEVESVRTMENEEFYRRAAAGDVDLWVNGWFPLHEAIIDEVGGVSRIEVVGTQVADGAFQGYLVDLESAEEHGVTSLDDLADPAVAGRFDIDGDGSADLIGCEVGWGCEAVIEEHLDALDLRGTVTHVQGDYAPLMDDVIERYNRGEPVLFYTWTPNWTVGELVPGEDVTWINVPDVDASAGDHPAAIAGIPGCISDPCRPGWPPNDIRPVGNSAFLKANPPIRRLLEAVEIPLDDIAAQNADMRSGEGSPEDIRQHAREWISSHDGEVAEWLRRAKPGEAPTLDGTAPASPGGSTSGNDEGTITVTTRGLAPFVVYQNGEYTGFSIELWRHVAERVGVDYEIEQVNSLAKQIDDVQRGAADVALGGVEISSARASDLALSQPTLESGLQIMVPAERGSGLGAAFARIATSAVVAWVVWFVVIFGLIVLAVGHIVWLLERDRNPDIPMSYPRGIAEAIWWSVVAITPFGAGNNTPRRNAGRVFAVGWILVGYFLLAYFTASITSTMAVDEIRGDITGPEDLAGHRVGTVAETPAAEHLTALGVGPVLFDSVGETYESLRSGELDAVVYDAPVLRHYAARTGQGDARVVGLVFEEFSYGIGVAHGSDLRARIDVALLELVENGVYDTTFERWFGSADQ